MDGISALMDGELDADEARRQLVKVKEDRTLRAQWDEFHLIGDAMRGESVLSPQFDEILSRRFSAEPTVLAPRRLPSRTKRFTTYAMSAAASLCGVALVAWMALGPTSVSTDVPPLQARNTSAQTAASSSMPASEPSPVAVAVDGPNLPSDGQMNEYMLAHQSFSPSTALQGIPTYIRSVSTSGQITGR